MTISSPVLHQATIASASLRRALQVDAAQKPYDWRVAYPTLAALDGMNMARSATIFPDDCPNTALDCYALTQLKMPINTGLALAQAAMHNIPDAHHDLAHQNPNTWLRLSPVHWQAGRDQVHLKALDDILLSETRQLLDTIAPWLAQWGWHIHVTAAHQWFIRTQNPFDYHAPCLTMATFDQLEHALPHGSDLKRWQTLLTEIQMAWFNHLVNQQREACRQLSINSVWLDHASSARQWTPAAVNEWQSWQTIIRTLNQPDIHAHLSELDHALTDTLASLKQQKTAEIVFLGDTWQQNINLSKPSIFARTPKKPALNWLETPQFDFLEH